MNKSTANPGALACAFHLRTNLAFLVALVLSLATPFGYATTATWKTNPVNGNWSNGANWSTGFTPTDAIFAVSSITSITGQSHCDSITFNPGASAYTISPFSSDQLFTVVLPGFQIRLFFWKR